MRYNTLHEVTGVGKVIRIRDKYTRVPFVVGTIQDEVSVSDGEQKQVIQLVALADGTVCEGDPTRFVFRAAYYTQRTDGWFCLGSQFAPILTPAELQTLLNAAAEKGWLNPS